MAFALYIATSGTARPWLGQDRECLDCPAVSQPPPRVQPPRRVHLPRLVQPSRRERTSTIFGTFWWGGCVRSSGTLRDYIVTKKII